MWNKSLVKMTAQKVGFCVRRCKIMCCNVKKMQLIQQTESEADKRAKQEFFALVREAQESGETFELLFQH